MASIHEEQVAEPGSKRLTFRQRFWLFGVGVPLLLIFLMLLLAAFLPRRLNSTEKKLLGRWAHATSPPPHSDFAEYRRDYFLTKQDQERRLWFANDGVVTIVPIEHFEFWTRLQLSLGFLPPYTDQFEIEFLSDDRYRMSSSTLSGTYEFQRLESHNNSN